MRSVMPFSLCLPWSAEAMRCRTVTPLVKSGQASAAVGRFLNRLSDFLFVAARYAAKAEGKEEIIYKKPKE